jgi:hypothetical protein
MEHVFVLLFFICIFILCTVVEYSVPDDEKPSVVVNVMWEKPTTWNGHTGSPIIMEESQGINLYYKIEVLQDETVVYYTYDYDVDDNQRAMITIPEDNLTIGENYSVKVIAMVDNTVLDSKDLYKASSSLSGVQTLLNPRWYYITDRQDQFFNVGSEDITAGFEIEGTAYMEETHELLKWNGEKFSNEGEMTVGWHTNKQMRQKWQESGKPMIDIETTEGGFEACKMMCETRSSTDLAPCNAFTFFAKDSVSSDCLNSTSLRECSENTTTGDFNVCKTMLLDPREGIESLSWRRCPVANSGRQSSEPIRVAKRLHGFLGSTDTTNFNQRCSSEISTEGTNDCLDNVKTKSKWFGLTNPGGFKNKMIDYNEDLDNQPSVTIDTMGDGLSRSEKSKQVVELSTSLVIGNTLDCMAECDKTVECNYIQYNNSGVCRMGLILPESNVDVSVENSYSWNIHPDEENLIHAFRYPINFTPAEMCEYDDCLDKVSYPIHFRILKVEFNFIQSSDGTNTVKSDRQYIILSLTINFYTTSSSDNNYNIQYKTGFEESLTVIGDFVSTGISTLTIPYVGNEVFFNNLTIKPNSTFYFQISNSTETTPLFYHGMFSNSVFPGGNLWISTKITNDCKLKLFIIGKSSIGESFYGGNDDTGLKFVYSLLPTPDPNGIAEYNNNYTLDPPVLLGENPVRDNDSYGDLLSGFIQTQYTGALECDIIREITSEQVLTTITNLRFNTDYECKVYTNIDSPDIHSFTFNTGYRVTGNQGWGPLRNLTLESFVEVSSQKRLHLTYDCPIGFTDNTASYGLEGSYVWNYSNGVFSIEPKNDEYGPNNIIVKYKKTSGTGYNILTERSEGEARNPYYFRNYTLCEKNTIVIVQAGLDAIKSNLESIGGNNIGLDDIVIHVTFPQENGNQDDDTELAHKTDDMAIPANVFPPSTDSSTDCSYMYDQWTPLICPDEPPFCDTPSIRERTYTTIPPQYGGKTCAEATPPVLLESCANTQPCSLEIPTISSHRIEWKAENYSWCYIKFNIGNIDNNEFNRHRSTEVTVDQYIGTWTQILNQNITTSAQGISDDDDEMLLAESINYALLFERGETYRVKISKSVTSISSPVESEWYEFSALSVPSPSTDCSYVYDVWTPLICPDEPPFCDTPSIRERTYTTIPPQYGGKTCAEATPPVLLESCANTQPCSLEIPTISSHRILLGAENITWCYIRFTIGSRESNVFNRHTSTEVTIDQYTGTWAQILNQNITESAQGISDNDNELFLDTTFERGETYRVKISKLTSISSPVESEWYEFSGGVPFTPVHCSVLEVSPWTPCMDYTTMCGGPISKTREIVVTEAQYGGNECTDAERQENRACSPPPVNCTTGQELGIFNPFTVTEPADSGDDRVYDLVVTIQTGQLSLQDSSFWRRNDEAQLTVTVKDMPVIANRGLDNLEAPTDLDPDTHLHIGFGDWDLPSWSIIHPFLSAENEVYQVILLNMIRGSEYDFVFKQSYSTYYNNVEVTVVEKESIYQSYTHGVFPLPIHCEYVYDVWTPLICPDEPPFCDTPSIRERTYTTIPPQYGGNICDAPPVLLESCANEVTCSLEKPTISSRRIEPLAGDEINFNLYITFDIGDIVTNAFNRHDYTGLSVERYSSYYEEFLNLSITVFAQNYSDNSTEMLVNQAFERGQQYRVMIWKRNSKGLYKSDWYEFSLGYKSCYGMTPKGIPGACTSDVDYNITVKVNEYPINKLSIEANTKHTWTSCKKLCEDDTRCHGIQFRPYRWDPDDPDIEDNGGVKLTDGDAGEQKYEDWRSGGIDSFKGKCQRFTLTDQETPGWTDGTHEYTTYLKNYFRIQPDATTPPSTEVLDPVLILGDIQYENSLNPSMGINIEVFVTIGTFGTLTAVQPIHLTIKHVNGDSVEYNTQPHNIPVSAVSLAKSFTRLTADTTYIVTIEKKYYISGVTEQTKTATITVPLTQASITAGRVITRLIAGIPSTTTFNYEIDYIIGGTTDENINLGVTKISFEMEQNNPTYLSGAWVNLPWHQYNYTGIGTIGFDQNYAIDVLEVSDDIANPSKKLSLHAAPFSFANNYRVRIIKHYVTSSTSSLWHNIN